MAPIPLEKLLNSTTGGALGELVQRAEGMGRLVAGLKQGLDPELAARLKGVNLRPDGQLVIIAETPAWAARLRFESDALIEAGLPFVFFTGYRSISIPDRFIAIPRIAKPASWRELKKGLASARERMLHTGLGSFRDSVEAALPALRSRARGLTKNHEDADRLVERTLEHAISVVGNRSLRLTIEDWLLSLLDKAREEKERRMLH